MTQTGEARVEWNPEKKHWQVEIQAAHDAYLRLSTAYQLGMADGGTGVPGVRSPRLADTFRCVAAAPAA